MSDFPSVAELTKQFENSYFARVPTAKRLPLSRVKAESRANAQAISGLYSYAKYILKQILPQTADDEFLELHAAQVGVVRKDADIASGTINVSGRIGSVIIADSLLTRPDGVQYTVNSDVIFNALTAEISVKCLVKGTVGNCDVGDVLTFANPIEGVDSSATVVSIAGGVDVETNASLLSRYLLYLQEPAHGGDNDDYVKWVTSVTGVTRAYVFPNEMGAGTLTLRIMADDDTSNGQASQQILDRCLAYLNTVRPITVKRLFVVSPTPKPQTFQISGLDPNTQAVKDAVQAELADLIFREAVPNGGILLSHIRQAISSAIGENDHVLVSPTANITADANEIITFGGVEWL